MEQNFHPGHGLLEQLRQDKISAQRAFTDDPGYWNAIRLQKAIKEFDSLVAFNRTTFIMVPGDAAIKCKPT